MRTSVPHAGRGEAMVRKAGRASLPAKIASHPGNANNVLRENTGCETQDKTYRGDFKTRLSILRHGCGAVADSIGGAKASRRGLRIPGLPSVSEAWHPLHPLFSAIRQIGKPADHNSCWLGCVLLG
jgi:hypothetical protein